MIKSLMHKAIYTQLVEKMINVNMGLDKTKKRLLMIAPNGKKKTILSENVSYMQMVIMLII